MAELQPIVVEHVAEHPYEEREKRNCARCNRGKHHPNHRAYPPSLNVLGGRGGASAQAWRTYDGVKKAWQARFVELLTESEMPIALGRVVVEGTIFFDVRRDRDQGNLRMMIEKALGDALTEGRWLEKDTWRHFEFGGLQQRIARGRPPRLRLVLFPASTTPDWAEYEEGEALALPFVSQPPTA